MLLASRKSTFIHGIEIGNGTAIDFCFFTLMAQRLLCFTKQYYRAKNSSCI